MLFLIIRYRGFHCLFRKYTTMYFNRRQSIQCFCNGFVRKL